MSKVIECPKCHAIISVEIKKKCPACGHVIFKERRENERGKRSSKDRA